MQGHLVISYNNPERNEETYKSQYRILLLVVGFDMGSHRPIRTLGVDDRSCHPALLLQRQL
jgi:hypothetical protein